MADPTSAINIFYSYAHEDAELRDKLDKHLAAMQRNNLIVGWHDRDIHAGIEWKKEINEHLDTAQIILLLISSDFIASDYCYSIEMKRALARHLEGAARVVPIIVRTVNWQTTELGKLQALPKDGKPVDRWTVKDAAWANVEEGIRSVIQGFRQQQRLVPPMQTATDDERKLHISRRYALFHVNASQEVARSFLSFDTMMLIGRDERADIHLAEDDKKASRYHCRIRWGAEGVEVFDLQSKNGTFVNEKRIEQTRLRLGDHLRCGRTVFRLEDYNATESEDADEP